MRLLSFFTIAGLAAYVSAQTNCYHFADPDSSVGNLCMCDDGCYTLNSDDEGCDPPGKEISCDNL
ncbi:hypothetical protein ANO14919_032440 [Xylariales sp. No.14919]|nr:hypothetical protein ANO14919_032440 [Xylariales sp. No.14919]